MNSKFDKETSEGLYTFNQDEVFEALAMWCRPKGIILDRRSVSRFDSTSTFEVDESGKKENGFIVEMSFNHKERKVG
jgi:hypothetical protein